MNIEFRQYSFLQSFLEGVFRRNNKEIEETWVKKGFEEGHFTLKQPVVSNEQEPQVQEEKEVSENEDKKDLNRKEVTED